MRRRSVLAMLAGAGLRAQSSGESFKVYTAHPRLLLSRRRLRLLQRERQRQSPRWIQFETLIRGKARMPEPGFALALFHQVSGELAAGRQAIAWAQAPSATDLRQIALVFDWCQGVLSGPERREISAKLRRGIDAAPAAAIAGVRSRVYAALALAGEDGFDAAGLLERVVREWWRGGVGPALKAGSRSLDRADMYPLFELLHALRDNFEIDLREGAPSYFRELPVWLLLSYYPAPYPAAENDYRIPFYAGRGQPDLRDAMLARAAEMAFLAYESNATETQFLQGWVMQDRFEMRGPFGVPYEFLWANPYHPGLSFHHVPLQFHSPLTGQLLLRSSWEEDAVWLGYHQGRTQIFRDGKVIHLSMRDQAEPLVIGDAAVMVGRSPMRLARKPDDPELVFIIGLKPATRYDIEADDEEIVELRSDAGGILPLKFRRTDAHVVRIREAAPVPSAR